MPRTWKRSDVAGFSSTFNLPTSSRPAISLASWSTTGAIIWQGPHQGAHISSNTGNGELAISAEKLASVMVRGFAAMESGVLQLPQIGTSDPESLASGTRLFVPQIGHRIMRLSGIVIGDETQPGC